MTVRSVKTRFRAYQLGSAGSSFSFCSDTNFVLVEARLTELSENRVKHEMKECGVDQVSTLHITSWDHDHCTPRDLEKILNDFSPKKIEYPGYDPHSDRSKECLEIILRHKKKKADLVKIVSATPDYIKGLDVAERYGYKDIFYHPKFLDDECANNNSTAKQFRTGSFNVLSLGDLECPQISGMLRRQRTIYDETDVMILAHHGADNGFTSSAFLKAVRPKVAIATSNYNQFDHPKQEIRDLLHKHEIDLFTTKTGDVIIQSIGAHNGEYEVVNLKADSTEISRVIRYTARKREFLNQNADAIRNRITRHNRGP